MVISFALASSCTTPEEFKVEPDPVTPEKSTTLVLTATLEQQDPADTKIAFVRNNDQNTYDVSWIEGETISVLGYGGGNDEFSLKDGAGTNKGTFQGDLSTGSNAPYCAIFPYRSNNAFDSEGLKISIPQTISAETGKVNPVAAPMVGSVILPENEGNDAKIKFSHLFGILKISVRSDKSTQIQKVVLHDMGGNQLWGTCCVPVDSEGNPLPDEMTVSGGSNTLELVWDEAFELNGTAKDLFFPVPANALDRGYSIVFYDDKGAEYSVAQKITSPRAVSRAVVLEINTTSLIERPESVDPKARGFYKSLFIDAGMYLSSYYTSADLKFLENLGFEAKGDYEYFAGNGSNDQSIFDRNQGVQRGIFAGSPFGSGLGWDDYNGVLQYPDGSPRFRAIYVNGGTSSDHGPTLGEVGRARVKEYFENGGSYTASCAGAFMACQKVDNKDVDYTFGIIPVNFVHTQLPVSMSKYAAVFTGMDTTLGMKAVANRYNYDIGDFIDDVRHHGGGYKGSIISNSEYFEDLMSYQYSTATNSYVIVDADHEAGNHDINDYRYKPGNENQAWAVGRTNGQFGNMVGKVSTFAYKVTGEKESGRAVITGSHPEGYEDYQNDGDKQNAMIESMILYALDGVPAPKVKGELKLGEPRQMNKPTEENKPAFAKIGDRQYHHFEFNASNDIEDFCLELDSDYDAQSGITLYLAFRKGNELAWISDADYVLCNKGGKKAIFIKKLPAGTWHASVYCETTPTTQKVDQSGLHYFNYSGKTEVLDGVSYTVKASKKKLNSSAELDPLNGDDFNNFLGDDFDE